MPDGTDAHRRSLRMKSWKTLPVAALLVAFASTGAWVDGASAQSAQRPGAPQFQSGSGAAPGNASAPAARSGAQAAPGGQVDPALQPVQQGQVRQPSSVDASTRARAERQNAGEYQPIQRSSIAPLGTTQDAWTTPMQTKADAQSAPGTIRFRWTPELIMPVRVRTSMVTTITLPEWETAEEVVLGEGLYFQAQIVRDNTVMIRSTQAGIDTSVNVIGGTGNNYTFYVRSESYNTQRLTDLQVFVDAAPASDKLRWFRAQGGLEGAAPNPENMARGFDLPGRPGEGAQPHSMGDARDGRAGRSARGSSEADHAGSQRRRNRTVAGADFYVPREEMEFAHRMFEVNEGDRSIAPMTVYTNGRFTFFHYGSKAATVDRPIVRRIVEGVETTVNTRWIGDNNEVLVAEATGNFVLRNGGRIVCVIQKQDHLPREGDMAHRAPDQGSSADNNS